MYFSLEDKGVLETVLHRFEHQRLPRILDIRQIVDQGGALSDMDIAFLEPGVNPDSSGPLTTAKRSQSHVGFQQHSH